MARLDQARWVFGEISSLRLQYSIGMWECRGKPRQRMNDNENAKSNDN